METSNSRAVAHRNRYRRSARILILATLLILSASLFKSQASEVTPVTCQVEANSNENFDYAAVKLWNAESPGLRGILCLVLHPLGAGGSTLVYPGPWIEFANRSHCALMAISFAQSDDPTANWCQAERGTGRALFAALDVLAKKTGNPSLKTVPITIAGVCAAGQFAFHLTAFAPNRIRAFVTIGGGKHDLSKVAAAARIPALIVVTPDRAPYAVANLNALFAEGNSCAAPWRKVSENISNYDAGRFSANALSFLEWSLENPIDSSKAAGPNTAMDSKMSQFLPVSICGERLPELGEVQPSSVTLNKINLLSDSIPTCSFMVSSTPNSTIDNIGIVNQNLILSARVEKIATGQWKVTCCLDRSKIPLGSSRVDVPVRFFRGNKQILGGTRTVLNLTATGEVVCIPAVLNLGTIKTGQPLDAKFHIVSQSAGPILISTIKSTYPWIQMESSPGDGPTAFSCKATPPPEFQGEGFGGYFQIKLQSPTLRDLRIFYFGVVDKAGSPGQGEALRNRSE